MNDQPRDVVLGETAMDDLVSFCRPQELADEIVLLCAFSGAGKSLLAPIIGSYSRMQRIRMETTYEYLCIMQQFGKMTMDACATLLRIFADRHVYEQMISREVNLRPGDDSGLRNNPHAWRTLQRLWAPDGDVVVDRIDRERPILLLMSHHLLPVIKPIFEAWGKRVRVVRIVRHPLYMVYPWYTFLERGGPDRLANDRRALPICFRYRDTVVPWWAHGWEERYLSAPTGDRLIYGIQWLTERGRECYAQLDPDAREQIMTVPFEPFVLDPHPWLERLATFMRTEPTRLTTKALRRQKCPRDQVSAGFINTERYDKEYAPSEAEEFAERKAFAVEKASPEALSVLEALCGRYKDEWDLTTIPDF